LGGVKQVPVNDSPRRPVKVQAAPLALPWQAEMASGGGPWGRSPLLSPGGGPSCVCAIAAADNNIQPAMVISEFLKGSEKIIMLFLSVFNAIT
jgi:hypothetical protein